MDKTGRRDGLRSCTHVLLVADCNLWEQGMLLGLRCLFLTSVIYRPSKRGIEVKGAPEHPFLDMHPGVILQLMNIVAVVLWKIQAQSLIRLPFHR
jgi:hypothetical protein